MSIETDLKRIADALDIIAAHVTANTTMPAKDAVDGDTGGDVDPLEVTSKKKVGRPARSLSSTANGAEAVPTAAPAVDPVEPAAPQEKISEQMLREELRQYIMRHETKGKGKGMEAAANILKKYDAKTVSTIKPENYKAIVDFCREDKKKYDAANKK
jgi:hypothetical protein